MSAGILFHMDITPPDFRPLFDGVNLNWDSLLSGAIGGLAILLLNILYGRAVAWWNRRQERKGLLRIIDAEVYENNEVLKPMIRDPDLAEQYPSRRASLSADAWEQPRARLAQLLRPRHIQSLVAHYASISRIKATLADGDVPTKGKSREEKQKVANVRQKRRALLSNLANLGWLEGEEIRKKGKKYIGTLPDYFGTAEKEAVKAATSDQSDDDGEDTDTEEASPT
jgi:hypothetical protein